MFRREFFIALLATAIYVALLFFDTENDKKGLRGKVNCCDL
jgi:hypothetical protein